jgi:MtrB/PioB family decaheme-associated outer membrane protein
LFAQGTYNRIGTPIGDTFEIPGQEMFEPTSYDTNEVSAQISYAKRNFLLSFDYAGSFFNNNSESIIWQNPFRLTHAQATLPAGALLRGRFAATQAALPPDNQAHTFTLSGLVLLPLHSKASALVSWGRWRQDEPFLPFTINAAITAPNLPAGVAPTSLAALPQESLDGEINTLNQDYAASVRPVQWLQLTARYNDYDLDNETPELLFPGYAGFGDSFWRVNITGQPGTAPLPILNEPKSFRRQNARLEGAFRAIESVTWKAAYVYERFSREHRQAPVSNEHGFLTSLSYAPSHVFFAKAGFRYADRTPDSYDPGTLEPPFLRMFDQAQRLRKQGDLLLSASLSPNTTISGSWFYLSDVYDKTFYGLHQQKTYSIAADVSWNFNPSVGLTAGWGYDRTGYDYLSVAKTAVPYNLLNTWARDTRDGVYSVRFGLAGDAREGKVSYQLSYELGLARIFVNTANPFPIVPTDVLNAQAFPFPEVKNQFHDLRLDASYRVRPGIRVGLYYLLEPFRINDFAHDFIRPYAPELIAPENDARRYMFLDVGPSNYTGNLIAVYVRYNLF